jgi:hypothetical protein
LPNSIETTDRETPLVGESFLRRLGLGTGAGATLFVATASGWRLAQQAGLARDPWEEDGQKGPGVYEVAKIGALAGAMVGVGYAVVRPILPRQPELAGLLYGFGSGFVTRLQANAILKVSKREPRTFASAALLSDALVGLWLAEAERLFS